MSRDGEDPPRGISSNTPPYTRHFAVGIDTMILGYHVIWGEYEALRERWEALKAEAGEPGAGVVVDGAGRYEWVIQAGGAKSKGGGPYYRWRFESMGMTVLVMGVSGPFRETPNVRVQVGASALLRWGPGRCRRLARAALASRGGRITGEKLSRLDVRCDLADVGVGAFDDAFRGGRVVRRTRYATQWGVNTLGRRVTGLQFGRGTMVRIYDKLLELDRDDMRRELYRAAVWGGDVPEVVTRVEFQLARRFLAEWGIEGWGSWVARGGAVVRYLCSEWFRVQATAVDWENRHQGRGELWDVWAGVQDALERGFRGGDGAVREVTRGGATIRGCLRQLAGLGLTYCAVRGERVTCLEDVVEAVADGLRRLYREKGQAEVLGLLMDRADALRARQGWGAEHDVG